MDQLNPQFVQIRRAELGLKQVDDQTVKHRAEDGPDRFALEILDISDRRIRPDIDTEVLTALHDVDWMDGLILGDQARLNDVRPVGDVQLAGQHGLDLNTSIREITPDHFQVVSLLAGIFFNEFMLGPIELDGAGRRC